MDISKVDREAERLARLVQFWHEMVADHRAIASDPLTMVGNTRERLTDDEFLWLVSELAHGADLSLLESYE